MSSALAEGLTPGILLAMARTWEEAAHKAIEEQCQPEEYLALCEIEAGHRHECR